VALIRLEKKMKTTKELSILLSIAVVAAILMNNFSPTGIALVGQWETSHGTVTAKAKNDLVYDDLEIGDTTLAKRFYDGGNALFVDARSREDYEYGHIKGAISLPAGEFDALIDEFLEFYSLNTPIITYCSGRTCKDSHHLAQLLIYRGYENVSVFIDGFPGWEAEGYPIE
jgi:rhodanese-related sulfurtransferase